MKSVTKVVAIVFALHVLVIGGIFVFEGCSRAKAPAPDMARDETSTTDTNTAALPSDMTATNTPTVAGNLTTVTPTPTVATVAPTPRTYVVKKGDTMMKIAKLEHISVIELAKANKLTKASALKIGQKLTVPVKAEATAVATATPAPAAVAADATAPVAAGGNTYTVKTGDSLWKIAKSQNVSVAALKQANNLSSDSLKVNQKLVIPAAAAAPATPVGSTPTTASAPTASYGEWQPGSHVENGQTFHTVDINESLAAIAKKYGVTVDDLKKANNIADTKRIMVGQKLVIPSTTATPAPAATPAVAAPIVSGT